MSTFDNYVDEYRSALDDWYRETESLNTHRAHAAKFAAELEEIKGEVLANAGTAEVPIDGKNAEQRSGQLALALAHHSRYQQCKDDLEFARGQASTCETNRDEAAHRLALCRRLLDHAIAELQLQAAVRSGNGTPELAGTR